MLWQFRRELIEKLATTGEVVISTPFNGHEEDFLKKYRCIETTIDRRSVNPIKDYLLYCFYKKLISTERPDVVVTYSIKPNIYGGYACRKLGVPYCVNVQGLGTAFEKKWLAPIVTAMYKVALKEAKVVFFENHANASEFLERGIIKSSVTKVLNGAGVNLDTFRYSEYPKDVDGIRFLYLGRIMKEKGIDELLEAIRHLKAKYGSLIKFDMVGFFEDEYKETINSMSRNKLIDFHGFQKDPTSFYVSSHCVVLPSYHEGMSNVLLEAAAIGRPLICSDVPGCREAVENGTTGFLCKKKDATSLQDAMEKFILLNNEERVAMGKRGREKMEQSFDKCDVVKKTIRAINK